MPATLEIIDEGHALKIDIASPVTMNEIMGMFEQAKPALDNSSHPVHILVDLTRLKGVPEGALRARVSPFFSHPNAGYQILVGANAYVKTISNALARMTNYQTAQFCKTMDEALAFLDSVKHSA